MLDAEAQAPGEWEVTCAIRLLERILQNCPRAFDVVVADALYVNSRFFNFVIEHNKDVIAMLKQEERYLFQYAELFFARVPPSNKYEATNGTMIKVWDGSGFVSWPQVSQLVRVVKTEETSHIT